jgi:hypothetical protein
MLIDRENLVKRHNPILTKVDFENPISLGNGNFALRALTFPYKLFLFIAYLLIYYVLLFPVFQGRCFGIFFENTLKVGNAVITQAY